MSEHGGRDIGTHTPSDLGEERASEGSAEPLRSASDDTATPPRSANDGSATRPRTSSHDTATIFDIQRFCVHDGPGIRTVVFFKGCGMACAWCQNPEGVRSGVEMAYYAERCRPDCSSCVAACDDDALTTERADRLDFTLCTVCGACADTCTADALKVVGRRIGTHELLAEALRDKPFFETSAGGVTLSGGEPVLQGEFLGRFLPLAREAGLNVVLETAGYYPPRLLEPLLPLVDLILFDVKIADPEAHRRWTGRSNELVVENLTTLAGRGQPLEVRMPLVPGLNTAPEHIAGAAALLRRIGVGQLTLLRYNHFWEAKLPRLATPQTPLRVPAHTEAEYEAIVERFRRHGISARL